MMICSRDLLVVVGNMFDNYDKISFQTDIPIYIKEYKSSANIFQLIETSQGTGTTI